LNVSAEVCVGVLSRIGIALDSDLLKRFDRYIAQRGYTNRSEAFRGLIRDRLVTEQTASPGATVVGTVTLIYNLPELAEVTSLVTLKCSTSPRMATLRRGQVDLRRAHAQRLHSGDPCGFDEPLPRAGE
jgi:Ribbon-helix-helix protein, copG family